MPQISLTGLKSGVPIGFMAALGAFRHAAKMDALGGVKLGWTPHGGQWCALLQTERPVDADGLPKLFADHVKSMAHRPEFGWSNALKDVSPEVFRERSELAFASGLAEWFQAFGSELACKDAKLQPTPFDMTVARQQFLADAVWLTRDLATPDRKHGDAPNTASFHEALFGPWRYQDNQHSLGWDPSTILMGAFTPKAPTAMNKTGVRAAVWLAMEALPFFPCFHDGGLATCGFQKEGRREKFLWPIWETPLTIPAVRALMAHSTALEEHELSRRGIVAVYASEVFKPNKYLTSFQPAELRALSAEVT